MVRRSISCTTVELHKNCPHLCTATDFPRHLEARSDSSEGHMSHGMIKSSAHLAPSSNIFGFFGPQCLLAKTDDKS